MTVTFTPYISKMASMAGASSPYGEGSRWCVDFRIGNCESMSVHLIKAKRAAKHEGIKETGRTFENSAAPHVCWLGPGPISTYCKTQTKIVVNMVRADKLRSSLLTYPNSSDITLVLNILRNSGQRRFTRTDQVKTHRSRFPNTGLYKSVSNSPNTSNSISFTRSLILL